MCRDPSGTMIAFGDMMRKQIVMPAHLMNDNEHMDNNSRNLFKDFSSVAQATGTYTGQVRHSLHQLALSYWPARHPTPLLFSEMTPTHDRHRARNVQCKIGRRSLL